MTPSPPTELHFPISGVTNAMGPRLLPSISEFIDCFSEAFSYGYFSMILNTPNNFESLTLFNQNSWVFEITKLKFRLFG